MQQLAWLHATPEGHKSNRLNDFIADNTEPDLPDIDADYLIEYLGSIGFSQAGNVLSSNEIFCWSKMSGIQLMPWEFDIMRRLSSDYISELHEAKDPIRPMPYMSENFIVSNRDAISNKISSQLGGRK